MQERDEKPEDEGIAEDEDVVQEEAEAAGTEAARIGGRSGLEGMDEAERASAEHGGGESEGFEQAEQLLEGQASHGDPSVDPERESFEAEAERSSAVYGEADEIDSTEADPALRRGED